MISKGRQTQLHKKHPHLRRVQWQPVSRLHTTSWGRAGARVGSWAVTELALLGRGLHGLLLDTGRALPQILYCCHSALGLHSIFDHGHD